MSVGAEPGTWKDLPTGRPVYVRATVLNINSIDTAAQDWAGIIDFQFVFVAPSKAVARAVERTDQTYEQVKESLTADRESFWPVILNIKKLYQVEAWCRKIENVNQFALPPIGVDETPVSLSVKVHAAFWQRFDYLPQFPFDKELLKVRLSMIPSSERWRYATTTESSHVFLSPKVQSPSTHAPASFDGGYVPARVARGPLTSYEKVISNDPDFGSPNLVAVDGRLASTLSEWQVGMAVGCRTSLSPHTSSRTSVQYSHITLQLPISRRYEHYVMNYIVPYILVTASTILAFFVDLEDTGDRLAIGVGLLLAALAFRSAVASLVPRLGEQCIIEEFTMAGVLFILVCTVVAVTVTSWPEPLIRAMCWVASWGFLPILSSFVTFNIFGLLYLQYHYGGDFKENKLFFCGYAVLVCLLSAGLFSGISYETCWSSVFNIISMFNEILVDIPARAASLLLLENGAFVKMDKAERHAQLDHLDNFLGLLFAVLLAAKILFYAQRVIVKRQANARFPQESGVVGTSQRSVNAYVDDTTDIECYCEHAVDFSYLEQKQMVELSERHPQSYKLTNRTRDKLRATLTATTLARRSSSQNSDRGVGAFVRVGAFLGMRRATSARTECEGGSASPRPEAPSPSSSALHGSAPLIASFDTAVLPAHSSASTALASPYNCGFAGSSSNSPHDPTPVATGGQPVKATDATPIPLMRTSSSTSRRLRSRTPQRDEAREASAVPQQTSVRSRSFGKTVN